MTLHVISFVQRTVESSQEGSYYPLLHSRSASEAIFSACLVSFVKDLRNEGDTYWVTCHGNTFILVYDPQTYTNGRAALYGSKGVRLQG